MVSFREATIQGQAPDRGLYFPSEIPTIESQLIRGIENLSDPDIAFRVIKPFIGDEIPDEELFKIVGETVNFPVPLHAIDEGLFSVELYHGNTLAFKDIGARFMSRCLGYFMKGNTKKLTVLVATSGDTGGAVADGFYGIDGVEVVILYPSGRVSKVQEKQLTSMGKNIHAIEVNGSFDDCQEMAKQAFGDIELRKNFLLTSANSINVARWLPQQFFYFFAYKQWPDKKHPPVLSVPSGNFGNICAGMLAMLSGLPVSHFVAACNANDVVPNYMNTKTYLPQETVSTISNAMDVGNPSNFIRILELFKNDFNSLSNVFTAYSINDIETKKTMLDVYNRYHYILDPHGAVGCTALKKYLQGHPGEKGIFMETAHPVKFYDVVEPVLNTQLAIPVSLEHIMEKSKSSTLIEADYQEMKSVMMRLL